MNLILEIITRRNIMVVAAFLLGLIFPCAAVWLKEIVLAVVCLTLTMYLVSIEVNLTGKGRYFLVASLLGICFSYFLLGNVLLLLSAATLYFHETIWLGFVVLATAPPVFSELLAAKLFNKDFEFPLLKTIGAYAAVLFIAPLMFHVLIDAQFLNTQKIIMVAIATVFFSDNHFASDY